MRLVTASQLLLFISEAVAVCQLLPSNRGDVLSDAEALTQITKGHDTMCVMLSSRHKNLETVRSVWAREDIKVGSAPPATPANRSAATLLTLSPVHSAL